MNYVFVKRNCKSCSGRELIRLLSVRCLRFPLISLPCTLSWITFVIIVWGDRQDHPSVNTLHTHPNLKRITLEMKAFHSIVTEMRSEANQGKRTEFCFNSTFLFTCLCTHRARRGAQRFEERTGCPSSNPSGGKGIKLCSSVLLYANPIQLYCTFVLQNFPQ